MFKQVVVGVPKTDRGRDIARRSLELASSFGAEVHLVCAVQSDGRAEDVASRHVGGFLDPICAEAPGITTHCHVKDGDPTEAILRVAKEVGADLIVVGNKGMKGVGRVAGSVPNAVAHRAPCSVLILDSV